MIQGPQKNPRHSVQSDRLLAASNPQLLPEQDIVQSSGKTNTQSSAQSSASTRQPGKTLNREDSTRRQKRRVFGRAQRRLVQSSFQLSVPDEEDDADAAETVWETTYRGMPSWLTSLILHLSLILLLALISVGDGGSKIVELLASSAEQVEIEPLETPLIELAPQEIETISDPAQLADSQSEKLEDIASIFDEVVLEADLQAQPENKLFESISSSGLGAGDNVQANDKFGAQFFGIDGTGSEFIYIVDCSGSMAQNVSRNFRRWDLAKRELTKSINNLTSDQRFLILLYNNGFVAMNNKVELVRSTKREQKKALRWLGNNAPGDFTFCAEALAKALSIKPDSIFLLSDGEFDDRQDVFLVLNELNSKRKLASHSNQQIPVHTIALGSHIGRWTMKRIAAENNGVFKLVE